jgi:hypothetical protein
MIADQLYEVEHVEHAVDLEPDEATRFGHEVRRRLRSATK